MSDPGFCVNDETWGFDSNAYEGDAHGGALGELWPEKEVEDYTELIDYSKTSGTWAEPLKSSLFVSATFISIQLRDGILNHIDANDVVVVVDVAADDWAAVRI